MLDNVIAIDLETECTVETCKYYGKSICKEDHSLSPWHSRITVMGVYGYVKGIETKKVFREVSALASYLDSLDPVVSYIGHNFKFDLLHLHAKGVSIDLARWVGDSQLAAYVLTEKISDEWLAEYERQRKRVGGHTRAGTWHSLKTLAPFLLDIPPFWEASGEHDSDTYVLKDCEYTFRIYDKITARLRDLNEFDFYISKQLPWTKLLLRAEMRGIKIDLVAMEEMEENLTRKADSLKQELDEQWHEAHVAYTEQQLTQIENKYSNMCVAYLNDHPEADPYLVRDRYKSLANSAKAKIPAGVDYGSPTQMLCLLQDYYQYDCSLPEPKTTPKGKVTTVGTGKEVLRRLIIEGKKDVEVFYEWRRVYKLLEYIAAYKTWQVDGYLHPIFNPDSTKTGRLSSARINMQQVTGELKKLFIPRPGYKFIGYDLAAIEPRLIALYSNDPELFELIKSGRSIHDDNVKTYFAIDDAHEEISKKYPYHRKAAKEVGLSVFYNAGGKRVRNCLGKRGFPVSENEARGIVKRVRSRFEKVFEFGKEVVALLEQGETLTNLLGRPIQFANASDCYMQGVNRLMQGSASDLNTEGALRAEQAAATANIEIYPLGLVHDFVLFEVKEDQAEAGNKLVYEKLTGFELNCDLGRIPLEAEGGVMDTWAS